jgi:bacitracin synthase 1
MGGQMPFGAESTAGDAAPTARPEMLTEYVPPRDDIERKLVDIFKSLLGFEAGIMDDFFEMGGDSLKASGVINKVNHTFGITVPVSEMFVRKNISGLAEYIRGTQSEDTKLEQMLKEIEAMPLEKP